MNIKINEQELELQYTFNSFKYMEDFNLNDLAEAEEKPFKLAKVVEILLLGALNYNPKVVYTRETVAEILNDYVVENSLTDLLEQLMKLMEDSSFFKSLQKNQSAPKKSKK